MKRSLISIILVVFVSHFILAQENNNETTELYSLELEDLMDVQVSSSTKSNITIQKAPSVIRVFTQADFEKFGFYTLDDVLNSIPGHQAELYRSGHRSVWARGVQSRYNNKILLLIDGVPMRDSFYGHASSNEMFPIQMIEKVEVINGPGSVLYGANSFASVINVTTKSKGKSVGLNYGTYNELQSYGEVDINNFYGFASYYQTDSYAPPLLSDGAPANFDQFTKSTNGFFKYQNKFLTATLGYANLDYPYKHRGSTKEYGAERNPIWGSVKFNKEWNEGKSNFLASAYVNNYNFDARRHKRTNNITFDTKEISIEHYDTHILGLDLDFSHQIANHNFLVGTSFLQDKARDIHGDLSFPEIERFAAVTEANIQRNVIGFFLQDVWEINKNIIATAGIRYDILDKFDNEFNYRFGLTAQSESNIYGKLLIGTAYRVPSYREYLDIVAFKENLEAEHLQTLEVQIGYLTKKADINLTFYSNSYTNFIGDIDVFSIKDLNTGEDIREIDDDYAFNFEKRSISGLELNAVIRPKDNLSLNAGASFILNATEKKGANVVPSNIYAPDADLTNVDKEVDILYLSDFNFFLLSNYQFSNKISVGLNLMYFSDRNVADSKYQTVADDIYRDFSNKDGYIRIDLTSSASIGKHLNFKFRVLNLLDSDIYSPPFADDSGFDNLHPGRQIRIASIWKF